jgi:hypothetical protein
MSTHDVAKDLVALCREGRFAEAGEKHWAEDVLSVEAMGEEREMRGKDAARGKGAWWAANHEVHGIEIQGPYVNGDQFAVRFKMEVTQKADGKRHVMDEVGVYTVKDGKVVEERFLYAG